LGWCYEGLGMGDPPRINIPLADHYPSTNYQLAARLLEVQSHLSTVHYFVQLLLFSSPPLSKHVPAALLSTSDFSLRPLSHVVETLHTMFVSLGVMVVFLPNSKAWMLCLNSKLMFCWSWLTGSRLLVELLTDLQPSCLPTSMRFSS